MANSKNYNYENLDRPYDSSMNRSDSLGGSTTDIGTDNTGEVVSPADAASTSAGSFGSSTSSSANNSNMGLVTTDNLEDLWIHNFIKSRSYKPKSQGFLLDGEKGYIECMKLYVGNGGIIGGALDVPDTTSGSSFHVDKLGNIWSGSATMSTAPFSVTNAGVLTATSGTIGGWQIQPDLLRSATSGSRVELNEGKNRISIFDAVNEKVVMGYLDGLPKHDGTGNWGVGDYGFWALAGDKLSIDGDGEYINGDWIIQHDAAYLINDALDNTIVRLGTDTGDKGLFIYDTSGNKLAKYTSDEIFVGDATRYLKYDTFNGLRIKGERAELNVGPAGYISGGMSSYNTLEGGYTGGFWMGADGGTYKLSLGSPTGDHLLWDGTDLTITGNFAVSTIDIGGSDTSSFHVDVNGNMWSGAATYDQNTNPFAVSASGALRATSATVSGALVAGSGSNVPVTYLKSGTIDAQTITLGGSTCYINSGKTSFDNGTAGFILGLDGSTAKFYIGNSSDYLNWTGSSLNISGSITGSSITGSSMSVTSSGGINVYGLSTFNVYTDVGVLCGYIGAYADGGDDLLKIYANSYLILESNGGLDIYSGGYYAGASPMYISSPSGISMFVNSVYNPNAKLEIDGSVVITGDLEVTTITSPTLVTPSFSGTVVGSITATGNMTAEGNVIIQGGAGANGIVQVKTASVQRNYTPKLITVSGYGSFYVLAYTP